MKKLFAILSFLLCFNAFAVETTNGGMNVKKGDNFILPVKGRLYQIGNKDLPKCFSKDTVVFDFTNVYYYEGKQQNVDCQMIISGIKLSKEYKNAKPGTEIKGGTTIGTAVSSPVVLNIRCKDFDIYLADTADCITVFENGWYYFGVGMLLPTTPKFLDYQEITGKKSQIDFWDNPDTLEDLYKTATEPREDGGVPQFSQFPSFYVCLKTKLKAYPEPKAKAGDGLMVANYFKNCTHYLDIKFDGIPVRLYFQNGFYDYLKEEYKLGKDIYIYSVFIIFTNGRFYAYVRDYSLISPKEIAQNKAKRVQEDMKKRDEAKE